MKIMVLNDGQTYTDLSGCSIIEVDDDLPDDQLEDSLKELMEGGDPKGLFAAWAWDLNGEMYQPNKIPTDLKGALIWLVDHVDEAEDVDAIIDRVVASIRANHI